MSATRLKGAWPYVAIFLFALAIRLVYLYEISDQPIVTILLGDAESYDTWAQEIVLKGWIGDRTFYQAPFYPYFLALVYTIGARDFILVRLVQILIGSASCVLLAFAGTRFFNKKTGLVAGCLLALYAPAIFFDLLVQKAVLGMFFMCLLLFLISRTTGQPGNQRQPGTWVLIGVCLACFALVRENALILIPAVGAWMIIGLRSDGWQRILVKGLFLGIGLCLIFLPVTLRNYVVGGEFVLTTSQLGPNFYIGNNRDATGFYEPLVEGHSDWKFERSDAKELAEAALGQELTPNQISDYWLDKAVNDIRDNPLGWLRLMGKKWLLVLEFDRNQRFGKHLCALSLFQASQPPRAGFSIWHSHADRDSRHLLELAEPQTCLGSGLALVVLRRQRGPVFRLCPLQASDERDHAAFCSDRPDLCFSSDHRETFQTPGPRGFDRNTFCRLRQLAARVQGQDGGSHTF